MERMKTLCETLMRKHVMERMKTLCETHAGFCMWNIVLDDISTKIVLSAMWMVIEILFCSNFPGIFSPEIFCGADLAGGK
jgi:hypothetical protein